MRRVIAGIAVATTCIAGASCKPSERSESQPTASSAARSSLDITPPIRGVKAAQAECWEEPAGNRSTDRMTAIGTFGGMTLYGLDGQVICSHAGGSGVGDCELTANSVAIVKGPNGSRALIASSKGTTIWYGNNGVSCVRQRVE